MVRDGPRNAQSRRLGDGELRGRRVTHQSPDGHAGLVLADSPLSVPIPWGFSGDRPGVCQDPMVSVVPATVPTEVPSGAILSAISIDS